MTDKDARSQAHRAEPVAEASDQPSRALAHRRCSGDAASEAPAQLDHVSRSGYSAMPCSLAC